MGFKLLAIDEAAVDGLSERLTGKARLHSGGLAQIENRPLGRSKLETLRRL